jgi:hypothetical protein
MVVPVLLAGGRATSALLQPVPDAAIARLWLSVLASYDAVFLTLALWVFDAPRTEVSRPVRLSDRCCNALSSRC